MRHILRRRKLSAFLLLALVSTLVAAGVRASTQREARAAENSARAAASLREAAWPLRGTDDDYDPLMEMIGDARFVLLGEASHGTRDFYHERARITQRLIEEKGFNAVAIEGNWPDAERVNRYIRNMGTDKTAEEALSGFTEFPEWMWRNTEVRDLARWLRTYNDSLPTFARRVGFYGLDLYSPFESAVAVADYLQPIEAEAARRARDVYECLTSSGDSEFAYGRAVAENPEASCARLAQEQVQDLEQRAAAPVAGLGQSRREDFFSALQNARVVRDGEEYFRVSFAGSESTWNLRDTHMAATLEHLAAHFDTPGRPGKIVAWAHNTHMGDARATQMGEAGELNVGQLMRQRFGDQAVLVGFTTYTGSVIAASQWDEQGQRMDVRPALPESFSAHFHNVGIGNFLLVLRGTENARALLGGARLERAIGVIYLPQTERFSHYFDARLAEQFDAVIHIDESEAVEPLQ